MYRNACTCACSCPSSERRSSGLWTATHGNGGTSSRNCCWIAAWLDCAGVLLMTYHLRVFVIFGNFIGISPNSSLNTVMPHWDFARQPTQHLACSRLPVIFVLAVLVWKSEIRSKPLISQSTGQKKHHQEKRKYTRPHSRLATVDADFEN